MASRDRVRLLDAKFELTRRLSPDERAELAAVTLPVVEVAEGPFQLESILETHQAFAAGVLDGVAVHAIQIGEQSGIQLLGPGDLLIQPKSEAPAWLEEVVFRAPAPMSVAVLAGRLPRGGTACARSDSRAVRLRRRPDAAVEQPTRHLPASARRAASARDPVAAGGVLGSCHAGRRPAADGAHARDPRRPDRRSPADRDARAAQAQRAGLDRPPGFRLAPTRASARARRGTQGARARARGRLGVTMGAGARAGRRSRAFATRSSGRRSTCFASSTSRIGSRPAIS